MITSNLIFPAETQVLDEKQFRNILVSEWEKAELCNKAFLLTLVDISGLVEDDHYSGTACDLIHAVYSVTRAIDLKGWFDKNKIIGIIFHNLDSRTMDIVLNKLKATVGGIVESCRHPLVPVSHFIYPLDWPFLQETYDSMLNLRATI